MAKRKKSGFCSSIDRLPWIVKLILAIIPPTSWILFSIYRAEKRGLLIGLLWFVSVMCFAVGWIIDIVTVAMSGKPRFLA